MTFSFLGRAAVAAAALAVAVPGAAYAAEPPVAVDDYAAVAAGSSVTVPVLDNDVFGEGVRVVPRVLADGPWSVSVTDSNQLSVTASPDVAEDFEVQYVLVDGGDESTATVRVTVEAASSNDADEEPTATETDEPECPDGTVWDPMVEVCGEIPGDRVQVQCAHSVRIERWVPGRGTVALRGGKDEEGNYYLPRAKEYRTGHKVLTDREFAHRTATRGEFCGDERYAANPAFRAALDQFYAQDELQYILYGKHGQGFLTADFLADQYPLGNYGVRAVTKWVSCEVDGHNRIVSCSEPEVAVASDARVTLACDGLQSAPGGGWVDVLKEKLTPSGCDDPAPKDQPKDPKAPKDPPRRQPPTIDAGGTFAPASGGDTPTGDWLLVAALAVGAGVLHGFRKAAR